jgi:hypothetical protein
LFSKYLRLGTIFDLPKDSGLLSPAQTSGDNMALKFTNLLVPQHASAKQANSRRTNLDDPSRQLHSSISEVGGYCAMPKSNPDGRARLNLNVEIDPSGLIVPNEEMRQRVDAAQELIKKKTAIR